MKRGREQIPEEEPLSKRINNLHLDGSSAMLNGSASGLASPGNLHNLTGNPSLTENNENSIQDRLTGLPIVPITNGLVNGTSSPCVNGIGPGSTGNLSDFERVTNELIAQRELPESLNIAYPSLNPTDNDQYFNFNKLLHDLHIEKLKRLGKVPL
ncbi:hypothetical protein OTU49_003346 [Cherax quadricarinatus]|uniref:Uncharacterized protein n=1 Tax=Cherax quadricarinatus TaxID=27406 RepID=A0AAW0YME9_CHEQU|nr:uncharacterized protein LOC128686506 [Cherax quadricarinatus]